LQRFSVSAKASPRQAFAAGSLGFLSFTALQEACQLPHVGKRMKQQYVTPYAEWPDTGIPHF